MKLITAFLVVTPFLIAPALADGDEFRMVNRQGTPIGQPHDEWVKRFFPECFADAFEIHWSGNLIVKQE